MSATATWAERYIERFQFKLVPLRGKVPIGEAWNDDKNLIGTVRAARGYCHANIGVCLEPSGLVSLDADDAEGARLVLAAEGLNLDALIAVTPTIIGRAPRLEFKAPEVKLGRKAIVWPPRAEGEKPVTVLELRAGRVQDVLPPSIHPDTHRPYRWLTPPRDGFPPLPESLLRLWLDFDAFKHRARNRCPWAAPEPEPKTQRSTGQISQSARHGPSVIAAFNDAHDTVAILESHGYVRAGRKRWKSPNGKNMAGVVLLPDGKVFCHHMSDALGDGKPHDSFDLYAHLEHGGDVRAAVKAAAQVLGLNRVSA